MDASFNFKSFKYLHSVRLRCGGSSGAEEVCHALLLLCLADVPVHREPGGLSPGAAAEAQKQSSLNKKTEDAGRETSACSSTQLFASHYPHSFLVSQHIHIQPPGGVNTWARKSRWINQATRLPRSETQWAIRPSVESGAVPATRLAHHHLGRTSCSPVYR